MGNILQNQDLILVFISSYILFGFHSLKTNPKNMMIENIKLLYILYMVKRKNLQDLQHLFIDVHILNI